MSVQTRQRQLGLVLAILGAVAFSGKAIIVKLAYRYGVDAMTVIMLRMVVALPWFLALTWWSSRGQPALTRRDVLAVVGLGFTGYYLASYLDFLGLSYVSASFERLLLYLNPTLVLLLGRVLFGKTVRWQQALGMAISYAGVLVVFGHELQLSRNGEPAQAAQTVLGACLVLASAVSYATYLVYSGEWVKRLGSLRLVGYASSVACVFCIAQFFLLKPLSALEVPTEVLWLSLLNGTFCTVVPVLLVMLAIERIGAAASAQSGMVGPLSTITMGILLLDEPFTWPIAMGTVLVMAGIYVFSQAPPVAARS
jgi:drug/metabolite transporter (DMT)-like permease